MRPIATIIAEREYQAVAAARAFAKGATWDERSQLPAQSDIYSHIQHLPTRVTIDNSTAERYTIIAAFAYDKMGLLYAITRTLFELGLSVSTAKIGTHLDQVVDVFYVTDQRSGSKVTDEHRLSDIHYRLIAAIEEVEKDSSIS